MSQSHMGPERGSPPSTPRWVKVFGIIVLVLALLVGIMLLTGLGGEHGPGRHMPSGGTGGHIQPVSVIEDPHRPAALVGTHRP